MRRTIRLLILSGLALLLGSLALRAQTGREFWFDVPEINRGNMTSDNFHVYLHVTALDAPATVEVTLPADPDFVGFKFNVPAGTKRRVRLAQPGHLNAIPPPGALIAPPGAPLGYVQDLTVSHPVGDIDLSLFYKTKQHQALSNLTEVSVPNQKYFIENMLAWAESNMNIPKPIINKTRKGVRLVASQNVNVYLEYAVPGNREIITLKGTNALGRKFYVPFQTVYERHPHTHTGVVNQTYNSFNIVATGNNTKVRITVKRRIFLCNRTDGVTNRYLEPGSYEIWLNRGETSIITPYQERPRPGGYQTEGDAGKRLDGSLVEVLEGAEVVVLMRDDNVKHTLGNAHDHVADQLVPVNRLGREYAIVRTNSDPDASFNNNWAFILATENNTLVKISGQANVTLNAGEQHAVNLRGVGSGALTVSASKPVAVLHVGNAIEARGGELAGAIIPPLPDQSKCIGSTKVAFSRAQTGGFKCIINLLAWHNPNAPATDPRRTSIGHFRLQKQTAGGFVDLPAGAPELKLQNYINNITNWSNLHKADPSDPNPLSNNWKWIQVLTDNIPGLGNASIQHGTVAYRLVNDANVFHLGIINGDAGADNMYGYFSDFSEVTISAKAQYWNGTQWEEKAGSNVDICLGESTYITADGPTELEYTWSPLANLEPIDHMAPGAPPAHLTHKSARLVKLPRKTETYTVTATGLCALSVPASITVNVGRKPDLQVRGPQHQCGDGNASVEVRGVQHVGRLEWFEWDGAMWQDAGQSTVTPGQDMLVHEIASQAGPAAQTRRFKARATSEGCTSESEYHLRVYPGMPPVRAQLRQPGGANECSPVDVELSAVSGTAGAPFPSGTLFVWRLGDGRQLVGDPAGSPPSNPLPLLRFENTSHTARVLEHRVVARDAEGVCTSEGSVTQVVRPAVGASILLSRDTYCEGETAQLRSQLHGAGWYQWRVVESGQQHQQQPSLVLSGLSVQPAGASHSHYTVELTARSSLSAGSCEARDVRRIRVQARPRLQGDDLELTYPGGRACAPLTVRALGRSPSHALTYEWTRGLQGSGTTESLGVGPVAGGVDLQVDATLRNGTLAGQSYTLRLRLVGEHGCRRDYVRTVEVPATPRPRIASPPTGGCPDRDGQLPLSFSGASQLPAGSEELWRVSEDLTIAGHQAPEAGPSGPLGWTFENVSFTQAKPFRVWLEARTPAGCVRRDSAVVTVYPRVSLSLQGSYLLHGHPTALEDGATLCTPSHITLQAAGAASYTWTFDDGSQETQAQVQRTLRHTGSTPAPYTVHLRGHNSFGCWEEQTRSYTLRPQLEARFEAELLSACHPVRVRLLNTSRPSPGPAPEWSLGAGAWDPGHSDVVVFETAGTHQIGLRLQDGDCVSEASPYQVSVADPVEARLLLPEESRRVCSGQVVEAHDRSRGADQVEWDFGDGSTPRLTLANERVEHVYVNDTPVPVDRTLRIRATRRGSPCVSESTATIRVYPQPRASSTLTVVSSCPTVRVSVHNNSSPPPDVEYEWELTPTGGEGAPVLRTLGTQGAWQVELTNRSPHEPSRYRGVHRVRRTYADGKVCQAETRDLPVVEVPPPLSVSLRADRTHACSGAEVRFEDRSTGGALQHVWDFGDGTRRHTSQLGEGVRHTYRNAGGARQDRVYTARVLTTQVGVQNGCTQESRLALTVHAAVQASLTAELGPACASPRAVTLRSTSEAGAPGPGVTTVYEWTPGDGQPSEARGDESPYRHAYTSGFPNQAETFRAQLSVSQTHASSGLTCTDRAETAIEALPPLQAELRVSPESGCAPLPVSFRASATGGGHLEHTWVLEPGTSRAGSEVQHVFSLSGSAASARRVVHEVRNEHGCSLRTERTVTVYPEVVAAFTLSHDPQRCTPFDVSVGNGSLGASAYAWYEDGVEDTEASAALGGGSGLSFRAENGDPQQVRLARYTLRAYTAHAGGPTCESTATRTLEIPPALQARFAASAESGCTPLTVTLRNESQGAQSHSWSFGLAGSSQQAHPGPVTLLNPSTLADRAYVLRLRVTNGEGCVQEAQRTVTVHPRVEARFLASADRGCAPLEVDLRNISPSPAYSYRWQLGDGSADRTDQDAGLVSYDNASDPPAPRTVTIRLEAQLRAHPECRAETSKELVVYPRVYADFEAPADGCSPLVGRVQNRTRAYQGGATYRWELPDGRVLLHPEPTLDLVNPSAESELGVTVRLVARSLAGGCEGVAERTVTVWPTPRAGFSFEGGNMVCPPEPTRMRNTSQGYGLQYDWSLGDGTEVSTRDSSGLTHGFGNDEAGIRAYAVQLQVRSPRGCKSAHTQQLFVYPQVRSAFAVTPGSSGCSPLTAQLTSQAQHAHYYRWTFGDGGSSTHPHPSYRFVNPGIRDAEYEVRLHARSQYGCEASSAQRVTVWPRPGASFSLTPGTQTYPGSVVTLENQSAPAADDWSYEWRFGDGQVSLSRDPGTHEYETWGPADAGFAFPVWLRVSSAHCADSALRYAVVRAPRPQSRFGASDPSGCPPLRVQFYNRSQYGRGYHWDFGDGTSSTQPEPDHQYDSARRYHVRLTVQGDGGESFSYQQVEVHPRPRARFRVFPLRPSLPGARVEVKNLTELGHTYLWDFGDGTVSTEEAPGHSYRDPGIYTVSLVARSEHGCVDSVTQAGLVEVVGGGSLRFPSAFSPSQRGPGDGRYGVPDQRNEVFHPFVEGSVREYRLTVFNRWGEQVFDSQDVQVGWDGYRGGQLCPQDVYAWRATGTYYDGTAFDLRGDVTLLRP